MTVSNFRRADVDSVATMTTMVVLPVTRAGSVRRVPSVCVRHGARATRQVPVAFYSAPPLWTLPLFLLGALPFLVVYMAMRKTVKVKAWPVCDACLALSHRVRLTGRVLLVGGGIAFPGGIALGITTSP